MIHTWYLYVGPANQIGRKWRNFVKIFIFFFTVSHPISLSLIFILFMAGCSLCVGWYPLRKQQKKKSKKLLVTATRCTPCEERERQSLKRVSASWCRLLLLPLVVHFMCYVRLSECKKREVREGKERERETWEGSLRNGCFTVVLYLYT